MSCSAFASTYKQCQVFDIVSLMKTLQVIESYGDDVMSIFQKSQMHNCEFIAKISFAQQMPRTVCTK